MRINEETAYLTPEEMAAKLRISIRKLQNLVKSGNAPEHIRIGNRLRFLVTKEAGDV